MIFTKQSHKTLVKPHIKGYDCEEVTAMRRITPPSARKRTAGWCKAAGSTREYAQPAAAWTGRSMLI